MTRVLIGHCGVDSGQIMIVDPCYVIDNDFSEQHYDECCKVTCGDERAGSIMNTLAVVSSTGWGDGYYPVYATISDGRIAMLEIDFHVLEEASECLRCGDEAEEGEEYCWRCDESLNKSEEHND